MKNDIEQKLINADRQIRRARLHYTARLTTRPNSVVHRAHAKAFMICITQAFKIINELEQQHVTPFDL